MTNHQCQHRLGDGRLCGSPRQATKNFCYYHNRVHESYVLPGNRHYNPPPLTDLHNISIALSHVWSALAKSMITHKQASAMAYQIQLARQTVKDILKIEMDNRQCGTDIPVGERGEAAPDLADTIEPSAADDTAQADQPIPFDPAHPPLCMEPALRHFKCQRDPAPDSAPTWAPISTEEYQQMREYLHMGPGDPTPNLIDLRRAMQRHLNLEPNPAPERISEVLFLAQQDIQDGIKDREDAVRRFRAKQRDEQNKRMLGLES